MAKLNDKQLLFCKEYLKDLNGKQAAIRTGYSEKTAKEQASRLLTNVNIETKIQELKAERSRKVEIEANDVLRELVSIGFANIQDYIQYDGDKFELKKLTEISRQKAAAISEVKIKDGDIQLKFHNKITALEKIARHIGMDLEEPEKNKQNPFPTERNYIIK